MTKKEAVSWAADNSLDPDMVIDRIRHEVKRTVMSWQSVTLQLGNHDVTSRTAYGYRKHTSGEYVSNAYRAHFGWKNTFYQPAELRIVFSRPEDC